jgi:elongation factor P
VKTTEFKAGTIFKMDNQIFRVIEGQMVQQPRLAAFMRAKIKNITTGAVQERNFKPSEAYDEVEISKRYMKFSYADGDLYHFMEEETFEDEPVAAKVAKDALLYNTEEDGGTIYTFEYADGKLLNIVPPTFVILRIKETEPAVAGDTARNTLKSAELETGLVVKVQMFLNTGDRVKVDTRTGEYVERVR